MAKCSYCGSPVLKGEEYGICPECKMPFHNECWQENGGCGTSGCSKAPDRGGTGEAYQVEWENKTKVCPYCSEEIPMKSLVCPLCKSDFATIHTLSKDEIKKEHRARKIVKSQKAGATPVWLFILSLTGILSPAVLLFGGIWYWFNKERIKTASPAHNLIALVGLCLSTYYFLLMIIGSFVF